jgi:hypothetical protein
MNDVSGGSASNFTVAADVSAVNAVCVSAGVPNAVPVWRARLSAFP